MQFFILYQGGGNMRLHTYIVDAACMALLIIMVALMTWGFGHKAGFWQERVEYYTGYVMEAE